MIESLTLWKTAGILGLPWAVIIAAESARRLRLRVFKPVLPGRPDPRAEAPSLAAGRDGYLKRQRLCRMIRRIGRRVPSERAALFLSGCVARRDLPLAARLDAAMTLSRWDPELAAAAVEPVLACKTEAAALKARLKALAEPLPPSPKTRTLAAV